MMLHNMRWNPRHFKRTKHDMRLLKTPRSYETILEANRKKKEEENKRKEEEKQKIAMQIQLTSIINDSQVKPRTKEIAEKMLTRSLYDMFGNDQSFGWLQDHKHEIGK